MDPSSLSVADHFSLKSALSSGLTSVATAGVGNYLSGSKTISELQGAEKYGRIAAQSVGSYTANYAANKMVGLKTSFSWKGMAAQVAGSIVGQGVSDNLGKGINDFSKGAISGFGASATAAKLNSNWSGGDVNYAQIAVNAFGNALGNGIVSAMSKPNSQATGDANGDGTPDNVSANQAKAIENADSVEEAKIILATSAGGRRGGTGITDIISTGEINDLRLTNADGAASNFNLASISSLDDAISMQSYINAHMGSSVYTNSSSVGINMALDNLIYNTQRFNAQQRSNTVLNDAVNRGKASYNYHAADRIASNERYAASTRQSAARNQAYFDRGPMGDFGDFAGRYSAQLIDGAWQGVQFGAKAIANGATLGYFNDTLSPLSSSYHSLVGEGNVFGAATTYAGRVGDEAGAFGSYFIDPLGLTAPQKVTGT